MKTLNKFLTENGFESIGGIAGLTNKDINVFTAWDGERVVVSVAGNQILVSTSEAEIIECVKAELAKVAATESSEDAEAKKIAAEVASKLIVAEYNGESARGKNIMIKDALSSIGKKAPGGVSFGEFQQLIEASI